MNEATAAAPGHGRDDSEACSGIGASAYHAARTYYYDVLEAAVPPSVPNDSKWQVLVLHARQHVLKQYSGSRTTARSDKPG